MKSLFSQLIFSLAFFLLFLVTTETILKQGQLPPSFFQKKKKIPYSLKLKEYPSDDISLQNIRQNIYSYAKILMERTNIKYKEIFNGVLPDSYPKEILKKAQTIRKNKKNWENLMSDPIEVWGFCVHPKYKKNSMAWCEQIYSLSSNKAQVEDCKNSFCLVCCDHLQLILTNLAESTKVGKFLMFDGSTGKDRIQRGITQLDVDNCRKECKLHYPVRIPTILPSPPRDFMLGTSPENSAKSCSDIKRWGNINSKSGEYWIDLGMKGKVKAYCDMETDRGGWTLFFNYHHKPSQDVNVNASKLPENLEMNSHINLSEIGFQRKQISELHFQCTEKGKQKLYIDFQTTNRGLIQLALDGDQTVLQSNSFDSVTDTVFPQEGSGWRRSMDESTLKRVDYFGFNKSGGFWDTPFGSSSLKRFWSAKSDAFECGSFHRDSVDKNSANLIETHHLIFFRGAPPDEEEVRARYNSRNFK